MYSLFEKYARKIKSGSSGQYVALCPFHDDKKHSFSFNDVGQYNCKTCDAKGNAISFAKHFNEDYTLFIDDKYKKKEYPKPSIDLAEMNKRFVNSLPEKHQTQINAINEVGWDSGCFTFPYFDTTGKITGIKRHKPKPRTWGNMSLRWYGIWHIVHQPRETLYIMEGEGDVNTMKQAQFGAVVSGSAGAKSIPPIPEIFKEFKEIVIIYDHDEAGREGANRLAEAIFKKHQVKPYIAQWRKNLPDKFDCSDDDPELTETRLAIKSKTQWLEINSVDPSSKPKGYTVMNIYDAIDLGLEKPPMIAEDLLNEVTTLLICAEDNVGKSLMANQLGICIATGQDFLGYQVPSARKVLLVQHEMENGEQFQRLVKQMMSFEEKGFKDLLRKNLDTNVIENGENLAITDQFEMLDYTFSQNPDIEVCIFDNIGMSTNVKLTEPDTIRNELKRLTSLCRKHQVAFVLVAHKVKVDWKKDLDLLKTQIQGGKPITDWAQNVLQLHTSSHNESLVLFKITKVRSIHNDDGVTTKNLNQGVWFNKNNDLLFSDRMTLNNWQVHFKALDTYTKETEFVKEISQYPQPFNRNDAINVGDKLDIPVPTVDRMLKRMVHPMNWLIKVRHGEYSINNEVLNYIQAPENNND